MLLFRRSLGRSTASPPPPPPLLLLLLYLLYHSPTRPPASLPPPPLLPPPPPPQHRARSSAPSPDRSRSRTWCRPDGPLDPIPEDVDYTTFVMRRFPEFGDRVAVLDGLGNERTYADLIRDVDSFANALQHDFGLQKNEKLLATPPTTSTTLPWRTAWPCGG